MRGLYYCEGWGGAGTTRLSLRLAAPGWTAARDAFLALLRGLLPPGTTLAVTVEPVLLRSGPVRVPGQGVELALPPGIRRRRPELAREGGGRLDEGCS